MTNDSKHLRRSGLGPPFDDLADRISSAFEKELYLCVDILSRKLLELMVMDILVTNPGPGAVWEDSDIDRRYTLHRLLTTFWEYMFSSYRPFIPQFDKPTLVQLKNTSWEIKKLGDRKAHNMVITSNKDKVEERQSRFQDLIDFLWYVSQKVPQSDTVLLPGKAEKEEMFTYTVVKPIVFPSLRELFALKGFVYDFEIPFEVTAIDEDIDCTVEVQSKSQALGFEREHPVSVSRWGGLRKEEVRLTLDGVISERVRKSEKRKFIFHGFIRSTGLPSNQKTLTIRYEIKCTGVSSGIKSHSGNRRIVVPLGVKSYIDKLDEEIRRIDIKNIPGIGPSRAEVLEEAGIKDVKSFVKTDIEILKKILGGGETRLLKMKDAAAKILESERN